jgi:hypothetical protein
MRISHKSKAHIKGYTPERGLVNFMRERVQFEKRHIIEELRGESLATDPDYNKLKRRKNYVVDKVFTSMANLVFFFESIASVPSSKTLDELERKARKELQKLFEDDVKDLLGIRRVNPDKQIYGFLFDRLIHSLIYTGDGDVDEADYFRLKLIHILQDSIFHKVQVPLTTDFSGQSWGIVLNDIGRASAWTEMLAKKVDTRKDDSRKPRNTLNFTSDLSLKERK